MKQPIGRIITVLYYVLYAFIYSGWLFHRSGDGTGFIYARSYIVFLVVAAVPFLLPTVVAWFARRGLLRKILIGLIPTLGLLAILYLAAAARYYWRQEHLFDPFVQVPPARLESLRQPKVPGEFRILAIGGSTTGGDRLLTDPTRYPGVLERLLAEKYPSRQIMVFNAGMGRYTTRHTLINYVTYYQDWNPDLVIEMHAINDIVRSFSPPLFALGPYDELYSHFYGPSINGARPPSFERVIGDTLAQWTYKPRAYWFSELIPRRFEVDYPLDHYRSIEPFERNIRATIKLVRNNGSEMMLVTQPSIYHPDLSRGEWMALKFGEQFCMTPRNWMQREIPSPESLGRAMKAYNGVVRRLAASGQVLLCEGDAAVEKNLANFVDDVHYSPAGAEKLARAVADTIIHSGVIERRTSRSVQSVQ